MLKSFFHTGFVVKDIEKSIAFYRDVMGLELLFRTERNAEEFIEKVVGFEGAHVKAAHLNMGNGHNLELVQYIFPPGAEVQSNRNDLGATHLAFYVERLDEYYAAMSHFGLGFLGPPVPLIQDGKLLRKVVFAQDPDNNWLEFVEVIE